MTEQNFSRIVILNRGEAAIRFMKTIFAFGTYPHYTTMITSNIYIPCKTCNDKRFNEGPRTSFNVQIHMQENI